MVFDQVIFIVWIKSFLIYKIHTKFCVTIRLSHNCPSGYTETSKYLPYNFSQYDFEKLIRAIMYS